MKIFLSILLAFISTVLYAQDTIVIKQDTTVGKQRRNELGIRTEFEFAYGGEQSFGGIQFKHFYNKNTGYRLYAGFGAASTWQDNVTSHPATIHSEYTTTSAGVLIAGGGLERQHALCRYLYLFGTAEVRLGYGWGSVDTTTDQPTPAMPPYPATLYTDYSGPNVHMLFIGVAASAGIKLQLKRFTAGLEIPLAVTDEILLEGHNSNNIRPQVDIAFFAHYRF